MKLKNIDLVAKVLHRETQLTQPLQVFNLSESQVVVLGRMEKLQRGDSVFAVYPDTTSFYPASVVQAPRKAGAGDAIVTVNFVDDADEQGITHDKAVLLKHVMRPP